MKRIVESTEKFKARIASIIGGKTEQVAAARSPQSDVGAQKASD